MRADVSREGGPGHARARTPVRIRETKGDLMRVTGPAGDVWIPAAAVERGIDRESREARAESVKAFTAQPGRAVEPCPILLAPDYGAARWGTLEDGDDVDVVLADHDFFGVRLAGKMLAFVPARSIRLLPSAVAPAPGGPTGKGVSPEIQALGVPDRETQPTPRATRVATGEIPAAGFATPSTPVPGAPPAAPLTALPEGSELPVLTSRVDPQYPEAAKREAPAATSLRAVVEANGSIGRIEVVTGASFAHDGGRDGRRSALDVSPGRVDGQPVAV